MQNSKKGGKSAETNHLPMLGMWEKAPTAVGMGQKLLETEKLDFLVGTCESNDGRQRV